MERKDGSERGNRKLIEICLRMQAVTFICYDYTGEDLVAREYIEKRDEGYYVCGTRVSLDSIVYAFLRGASPEAIARSFPVLGLEEVYGAITFYLANQDGVDSLLAQTDHEFQALGKQTRPANQGLYKKLEEARQQIQSPRK